MEQEPELADADAQIEALDEQLTTRASQIRMDSETPVRLTMQLIRQSTSHAQRPQDPEDQQDRKDDDDDREEEREIESMLLRRVLRLDWLNIGRIENLDAFTHVQELYLQHNLIERIENLDDHSELTFLALGDNRIRKVENLRQLTKVMRPCLIRLRMDRHGLTGLLCCDSSSFWISRATASRTLTSVR